MYRESMRQIVHISGLAFIILAQFIDKISAGLLFLFIAVTFFLYSQHLFAEQKRIQLLEKLESQVKKLVYTVERKQAPRPFLGAMWLFIGLGVTFLLFPLPVATVASLVLVIADSVSTLLGSRLGKKHLIPSKTLEGTLTFFLAAFIVIQFFYPFSIALLAALVATGAEILPNLKVFSSLKKRGLIDDNLTIPIITALVLLLA